jgi:hypothetical protein
LISLWEEEESLPTPRLDFIERRTQPGQVLPDLRSRRFQRPRTQFARVNPASDDQLPDSKNSINRYYIAPNNSP